MKIKVKNSSSFPKFVDGNKIEGGSEVVLDVDEEEAEPYRGVELEPVEHRCDECGRSFKSKQGLSNHARSHKDNGGEN